MKIQTNRHLFMLAAIGAIMIFGTVSSAFAQKSLNAKYPQPDFSAMADYWEVVSYEYDFTGGGVPTFTIVARRKAEKAPHQWYISWRDANGVIIAKYPINFDSFNQAKVGDNTEASSHAPFKADMSRVQSVVAMEDPNGN